MCRKCMWLTAVVLVSLAFAGLAHGQSVKINFQLGSAVTPEGYLPDSGLAYGDRGNGWSYGWSRDITADSRERNAATSPDKRWDTLVHLQKGADAVWEIAIANAEYNLYIVAGDPSNTDQTNTFDVEGVIITDPDGQAGNFDEFTLKVKVADGRLTLKPAPGSSNSKICFIDIIMAMAPESARTPSPAKEASDVPRDVVVTWEPGQGVSAHDVYFGASFEDVNNASRANPLGVLVSQEQMAATYDPSGLLEFDTTYYWRIDEVLTDGGIFKGEVWSFTTEPFAYAVQNIIATASSAAEGTGPENTINSSGLNESDEHSTESTDMWLTTADAEQPVWIQYEFDRVYKMYEMLVWNYNVQFEPVLGFGAKDVTVEYSADGVEWTVLGEVEFAKAAAVPTYAANTTVDLAGVPAKYIRLTINDNWGALTQIGLSEVRFLYIPAHAREPQPAAGAADVSVDSVLSWRAGRDAASHEVYFGTNQDELPLAGSPAQAAFTPSALEFGVTYYWKVDEVADDGVWAGELWSFSTQEYALIDGFETYDDDIEAGTAIFDTWIDGWVNDNGSTVGYFNAPFAEQTIVNSGGQSMPLQYDNTATPFYSEAVRTFDAPQDWTANGIKSLSLYFQGAPDNGGQLYLKINNTKVPYSGDAANIAKTAWLPWNIDLSTVGGNLRNVTSLTIGIEGSGATGILYVDDIRLYPKTPEFVTPTEPDSANLLALYAFEGNANDTSGHGLNGAITNGQLVASGRPGAGNAVELTRTGNVNLGNPALLDFSTGDWTVTAWFKTGMTGTGDANKGTIYGKGGDTGGGHRYALIMSETTEGIVSLICDDDVTKYVTNSTSVTNDDEWHFVVGQREGTALRIFIDGQLEGTSAATATYSLSGTSQHNAYIGAITNHTDGSLYKLYGGLIDDVRVYDKALSEGEILWLAGQTSPVAKPF